MTGDQTTHITMSYKDGGTKITCTYAIREATLHAAQVWSNRSEKNRDPKLLQAWLEQNKCHLDSPDDNSPAKVEGLHDGSTKEEYYRDGQKHHEGGPAAIWSLADGSTRKEYYRYDKLHREDGPAVIEYNANNGSTKEVYYRDGRQHREDGPAVIERNADGSGVEEYWRDGKFIKVEGIAPLSTIAGVTIQPPAPKAPAGPRAPAPA
jgi:hypothetical protein